MTGSFVENDAFKKLTVKLAGRYEIPTEAAAFCVGVVFNVLKKRVGKAADPVVAAYPGIGHYMASARASEGWSIFGDLMVAANQMATVGLPMGTIEAFCTTVLVDARARVGKAPVDAILSQIPELKGRLPDFS